MQLHTRPFIPLLLIFLRFFFYPNPNNCRKTNFFLYVLTVNYAGFFFLLLSTYRVSQHKKFPFRSIHPVASDRLVVSGCAFYFFLFRSLLENYPGFFSLGAVSKQGVPKQKVIDYFFFIS